MTDEQQQLIKLQSGSYRAFNHLYHEYFHLLYGFVFSLTRSHDESSHIVQETFIKVWIHRTEIRPEDTFKAWLFKMAKNQVIDRFRAKLRDPLFEDYMNFAHDEKLSISFEDSSFDFEQFKQALQKAKNHLSPRQAQAFQLCKEEGLNSKEVAAIMQVSEQAVYNYLSQALSILKKVLSPSQLLLFLFFFR